jgi:hypothetical protein
MRVAGSCSDRTMERRIRRSGEGSVSAGGFAEATHRGVVGLSNETIVVLAIKLNDWRALRVETGGGGQSCQEGGCCNGDSSGVDHFVRCVTTIEAVAAERGINS